MSVRIDRRRLALAGVAALAGGCGVLAPPGDAPGADAADGTRSGDTAPPPAPDLPMALQPPSSPREFRAAWVASVANIDWPSRPGLPNAGWRAEALGILDRAQAIGLNAVVLQVRPAGDALYASALEPWSEYLTGVQGRAPAPADDPLALWVDEAHRRGLQLHAWFNPYRARLASARSPLVAPHLGVTHAHAVKRYGDLLWMDPAEADAAARTLSVVADVVRRYDIDGVHIDDYFYPYPVRAGVAAEGADLPFPDEPAWRRYRAAGGRLERADWRREHVDRMVEALHRTVHEIKPAIRVGISPFGIGKPALRPAGVTGFSQYDRLFADVERWLDQGWLDYLAPQLYWPIDRPGQAFGVLLDYWLAQNARRRHIWPGLYTSRVGHAPGSRDTDAAPAGADARWPASEVLQQIELVRARSPGGGAGHLHFSMVALMQDRDGIATRLRSGPYAQPALVPAAAWLGGAAPAAPSLRAEAGASLSVEAGEGRRPRLYSVWRRNGTRWSFAVVPAAAQPVRLPADADLLAVRAVDAQGLEGPAAVWRPGRTLT